MRAEHFWKALFIILVISTLASTFNVQPVTAGTITVSIDRLLK